MRHLIDLPPTSNIVITVLPPLLLEPFEMLDVALQMEDATEALQFVAISLLSQIVQFQGNVLEHMLCDDLLRHWLLVLTNISE